MTKLFTTVSVMVVMAEAVVVEAAPVAPPLPVPPVAPLLPEVEAGSRERREKNQPDREQIELGQQSHPHAREIER